MDPLATYQVTRAAVEKAKADDPDGLRPTLVEAVQYRFGAHTTADDPSVYRDSEEVEEWRQKDPLPRLETFLRDTGRLDDETVDRIDREVQETVADAIETAESTPRPDPAEMFDHTYADRTPDLAAQYESFVALRDRYGDEELRNE
jgi:pyruvate dehydrogenase E1 component alpha subunit